MFAEGGSLCSVRPGVDEKTEHCFCVGALSCIKGKRLGEISLEKSPFRVCHKWWSQKTRIINAMSETRSTWSISVFIKALWQIGRKEKQASPLGLKWWWIFFCLEMEFILKRECWAGSHTWFSFIVTCFYCELLGTVRWIITASPEWSYQITDLLTSRWDICGDFQQPWDRSGHFFIPVLGHPRPAAFPLALRVYALVCDPDNSASSSVLAAEGKFLGWVLCAAQ